jgi:hypothetical protein
MNDSILPRASSVLRAFFLATSTQETGLASDKPWSKPQKETSE